MKFQKDKDTGDLFTRVKVTFKAAKAHVTHAIAVQIDSGRGLHEITRTSTAEVLEALYTANGTSQWPAPSKDAMDKAVFKTEDLFPVL